MAAKKAKKARRTPQRTCVVCRTTADKRTLTRLVRTPDDGVHVDLSGKRGGRGAYLCDERDCWERALNSNVLAAALRTTLTETDRARIEYAAPAAEPEPLDE